MFCWNNYPLTNEGERDLDKIWAKLHKAKSKYTVFGFEIAPTTGTPHLQGYMEFKSSKKKAVLIQQCPGIHWGDKDGLPPKGSAKDNYIYATKDGDFLEEGEMTEQGKRMDLEQAMEAIKLGESELDLFENHTSVAFRYPSALQRYRLLVDKKKSEGYNKKEIRVYWGDTGTGKTRSAVEEFPSAFIVSEGVSGFWWDGYDGEETVIMDEFRGNIPLSHLLRILDGYSCQVSIKGGSRLLTAKTIIITSNTSPYEWYGNADERSKEALVRRLDIIKFFDKNPETAEVTEGNNSKLPSLKTKWTFKPSCYDPPLRSCFDPFGDCI